MTSGRIAFKLPGEPKGKGRPRAVAKIRILPSGQPEAYVQLVTPADTREEEARLRAAFRRAHPDHRPWSGPVLLRFTAVFETPKGFNRKLKEAAARGELYAIKRPDKDNIEKLITDALNGVAFRDDQQVMGGGVKRYGSPARLEISLEPLSGAEDPKTPGELRAERSQAELPLPPKKGRGAIPTKTESRTPPDLSVYNPRQRALIEAAMRRDEEARQRR